MTRAPAARVGLGPAIVVPAPDLVATRAWFEQHLGARARSLHPADDPAVIVLELDGTHLRLERDTACAAPTIAVDAARFADADPSRELVAPGGTVVVPRAPATRRVPAVPELAVSRADTASGTGRAGMSYRDLVPRRHGGAVIASCITVPDGPVGDEVHHHDLDVQLIVCDRGRVRLVYEAAGEPFWLRAGDALVQPPGIRHRVLEAADDLAVIEIASPAQHLTEFDPDTPLPSPAIDRSRRWRGQRFVVDRADDVAWTPDRARGWEVRDGSIAEATLGAATVRRRRAGPDAAPTTWTADADETLRLLVVRTGSLTVRSGDHDVGRLDPGDSVALPPGEHVGEPGPDGVETWEIVVVVDPAQPDDTAAAPSTSTTRLRPDSFAS